LSDAFREGGPGRGATLPVRLGPWKRYLWLNALLKWLPLWPLLMVDYIWRSPSIRVHRAWIGLDAGSDHLPMLAQVSLQPIQ
jgi:endonuclease/exonuclease/phosphatase (EEP) superfamily protein YafD